MESALIVSNMERTTSFFTELLNAALINHIAVLQTCAEARRLLLERDFDLVLVNAPLADETGEKFACQTAIKGISQVILAVKSEHFDGMSAKCENDGVLTIAKPLSKAAFWSALTLAKSSWNRMKRVQTEDIKIKQRIDDIRIVDRAKFTLITNLNMSEKEAHRFIEKQAMDMRSTKRAIAEEILKTYEN
jgi:response regulator NasT